MDIIEKYNELQATFSEAIVVSGISQIRQNGVYLYFDGTNNVNTTKDNASFAIIVAGNSLAGRADSALSLVADIRKRVFAFGAKYGKNYFKGVKAAQFEGSTLFLYAVLLEIEIDI